MTTPPAGRRRALFALSAVLALTFLLTGGGKLVGMPPSPENFTRWGLSMTFMRAVGIAEVVGGLALLVPRVAPFAALGLVLLMFGALKTGVEFRELLHVALPAVLLLLLGFFVYTRRDGVRFRADPNS